MISRHLTEEEQTMFLKDHQDGMEEDLCLACELECSTQETPPLLKVEYNEELHKLEQLLGLLIPDEGAASDQ